MSEYFVGRETTVHTGGSTSSQKMYKLKLERDEDGSYVVTCPEIQGVVTQGESIEEALKMGAEAVNIMLDVIEEEEEEEKSK